MRRSSRGRAAGLFDATPSQERTAMAEKEPSRRLSLELTQEQMRALAPLIEETGKLTIAGTVRGNELSVSFIARPQYHEFFWHCASTVPGWLAAIIFANARVESEGSAKLLRIWRGVDYN